MLVPVSLGDVSGRASRKKPARRWSAKKTQRARFFLFLPRFAQSKEARARNDEQSKFRQKFTIFGS